MHFSVKQFVDQIPPGIFNQRSVLEVGSLDINGSIKGIVKSRGPSKYLGIDFMDGPSVDQVVDCENLVETFGDNSFDVVVCCEMLEHAEHWRVCIDNMKRVASKYLLITTRGPGFGHHEYPNDFWRYKVSDMKQIFANWNILILQHDPQAPGVFLLAEKTTDELIDLNGIELESAPPEK